jgi:tetratricopeptide (TPR) repeat protein
VENKREKEFLHKARGCMERREFASAQLILSEIIESNDKNIEAFFCLANIFHLKGELSKAIKAFKKVLELDPSHTDAAIGLSVLYNDIGRYEEARVLFEKTDERVRQGHVDRSFKDQHINKKFALKHSEIADMYMSYNRYEEALFEYSKAVMLDPSALDTRIKLAKAYSKKGFVSKAFDELRKLKNEYPHHIPARVALGVCYYTNGNIVEAQTEWQQILSKEPTNQEAAMYLNLSRSATETSLSALEESRIN